MDAARGRVLRLRRQPDRVAYMINWSTIGAWPNTPPEPEGVLGLTPMVDLHLTSSYGTDPLLDRQVLRLG